MPDDSVATGQQVLQEYDLTLSRQSTALMKLLESKPGIEIKPMFAPRGKLPNVLIYKVMGKMFAILAIRGTEGVILKCDPEQVPLLHEQYEGIGHRSHLDRRFWISVKMNSDVPAKEINYLAQRSYELVCANLTAKQRAQLAEL